MLTEGPMGIGSRRLAVIRTFGSRTRENEAEMIGFEPNRRMVVKSVRSAVPFLITHRLRADRRRHATPLVGRGAARRPAEAARPLLIAFHKRTFSKDLARLRDLMSAGEL